MTTTAAPTRPPSSTRIRIVLGFVVALVLGLAARGIIVDGTDSAFARWLPWLDRTTVNMFFADPSGEYLVPVTRTVSQDQATPEALMTALLAGPSDGTGLTSPIPAGATATTTFSDGVLTLDLGGTYSVDAPFLAHESILQSVREWPGVRAATVTIGGLPLDSNSSGRLLYFYDERLDMLVAQPTNLIRTTDVLAAWMEGPPDDRFVGLPDDIEVTGLELGANELLTLDFTFTQSLRDFAVDHPDSVRRVLEGLIATFNTGFPDVGAVLLDFEGQNALGLGQCANLLNTAQTLPEVLNDERLLARFAEA